MAIEPNLAPGEPSDAEVVGRVRGGDREAYRTLVRRYQDALYRYAFGMTGQQDVAADLTQAALVKAYTQIDRCRDPERFGAWVYRIVVNACKDHLKSRRRRDVSLDGEQSVAVISSEDPIADLERSELRRLLDGALARLTEPLRQAFVMKHVEGRSYEEIAELMDVSVPALKMRVMRAREAMKEALEEVL
jgi:RNA polymerase sigma-70 factor, ECF subfamily